MTITALTGPGRVVQFLWGPNQQNTLTFGYPLALDNPRFWRSPRVGSEQVVINDRAESWTTARDYYAAFLIRWVPLAQWSGGAGVQAFLDWATGANPFTFVPDAVNAPNFVLSGCILTQPFDTIDPQIEPDGSQSIDITFRNPTYDLGLAWRGLQFEYMPGADITSMPPAVPTSTRAGLGAYFGIDGLVHFAAANVLRDKHYPGGFASGAPVGPRTTLIEANSSVSNIYLQSQALATGPWGTNLLTATNNSAVAPDGTTTATFLVPNATNSATHQVNQGNLTFTAGENFAISGFFKAGGYSGVQINIGDGGGNFGAWYVDLVAQTIAGAGFTGVTSSGQTLVVLSGGWVWVGMWGKLSGAATLWNPIIYVFDTGPHAQTSTAYAGDTVKGVYAWGMQVERNGTVESPPPSSYVATTTGPATRNPDVLQWAWPFVSGPMWVYVSYVDTGVGRGRAGGNPGGYVLSLGTTYQGGWLLIDGGLNAGGSNPQAYWEPPGFSTGVQATGYNTFVYGTKVELLAQLFPDGSIQIAQSINGGADTLSSRSAAQPGYGGAFSPAILYLTWSTFSIGHRVIRIGDGVLASTPSVAKARAA